MINERIKYARKISGYTQKNLGEKTGISESTIRKYELGILNPKIDTIHKIADAFGLSSSFFTCEEPFDNIPMLLEHKNELLMTFQSLHLLSKDIPIENISDMEYFLRVSAYISKIEIQNDNRLHIFFKVDSKSENNIHKTPSKAIVLNDKEKIIISLFNKLNNIGQEKALERIEELTKINEYTTKE